MTSRRRRPARRGRIIAPVIVALTCLAVATPATAKKGPCTPLGPGNGPLKLVATEYPPGTGFMFGTYDYSGSWEDDLWRFGDPVSLIFLSRRSMTAATIESVLRNQLGFNATAAIADEGGLAVAYDDLADATRMSVWCGFPQGNRLQPDPADEDSFFHVRVYAYNGIWWHRRSSDPYMVVATCHVDVNEAMDDAGPEKVPSGFPVPRLPKYAYYRFAGNSESVEDYIADRWAEEFGEANVSRDTVWLGNSENAFTVTREALVSGPTGATGYAAYATWWKCDGYATVLRWP